MDKFVIKWRKSLEKKDQNSEGSTTKEHENVDNITLNNITKLPTQKQANESSSDMVTTEIVLEAGSQKRKFLPHWTETYKWLSYDQHSKKAFCEICTEAYDKLKIQRSDSAWDKSYKSFVKEGFSNWKNAIERFKAHEKSESHRKAVSAVSSVKTVNVSNMVSNQALQQKQEARICLLKIFESIRFLAVQGIPIRGHTETDSNFVQLLQLRSIDQPLLKSWLERTSYKWLSHDVINEILSICSLHILRKRLAVIRSAHFYAFMCDETTDCSRTEQMSINFRIVDEYLKIHEIFLGFYDTPATDAETLFAVVKDVFIRYQLEFEKCRGQCYDGAFNMSGHITGLQTRFREIEPRALYTHCAGHNLNLVAQDATKVIPQIADFLSIMKDLVTFCRASAKRKNIFNNIEFDEDEDEVNDSTGLLKAFCPTRWTVRVKSLKSIKKNYKKILKFCDLVGTENSDSGIKARGYSSYLRKFESLVLLEISISTLEKIEELNETIQATSITFKSIIKRVDILKTTMNENRTDKKFYQMYTEIETLAKSYDLEMPVLPRKRVMPLRFDAKRDTAYFPESPESKYRAMYFEVIDRILVSVSDRFDEETYKQLSKMEEFGLNKCDINEIKTFLMKYGQCDFDIDRLVLHRGMFFDFLNKQKVILDDLSKVSIFLQKEENKDIREFCSEYTKFIKLLLTYPQTICVAERSFSSLKMLKTYMSSTMGQQRTNDLAILYIHNDVDIDMDKVLDDFISRATVRRNTFATKADM